MNKYSKNMNTMVTKIQYTKVNKELNARPQKTLA